MWLQRSFSLRARARGFHLVTAEVLEQLPELGECRFFNQLVPQGQAGYEHDYEGPDDLPAHFKSSLLGCSLSLPVQAGRLALGTWQGIYLGEHRDQGGARRLIATLQGE